MCHLPHTSTPAGDTMNTSSRMESTSKPGCIQISATTYEILDDDQKALFKPTGGVQVKVRAA